MFPHKSVFNGSAGSHVRGFRTCAVLFLLFEHRDKEAVAGMESRKKLDPVLPAGTLKSLRQEIRDPLLFKRQMLLDPVRVLIILFLCQIVMFRQKEMQHSPHLFPIISYLFFFVQNILLLFSNRTIYVHDLFRKIFKHHPRHQVILSMYHQK